jgi:hypothetical protein
MSKGRTPFPACGPFLCLLLLAGCGDRSTPSAEENRQLDNAAEMLDSAPGALANIDENALGDAHQNSINTAAPAR